MSYFRNTFIPVVDIDRLPENLLYTTSTYFEQTIEGLYQLRDHTISRLEDYYVYQQDFDVKINPKEFRVDVIFTPEFLMHLEFQRRWLGEQSTI